MVWIQVFDTIENAEALSMLLSPGKFLDQNKTSMNCGEKCRCTICLVRLQLSQDAYGILGFLWNKAVVVLILML